MRKRALLLCAAALLVAACSPAGYPLGTPFHPHAQRRLGPAYQVAPALPIGRWDNVMLLPADAPVHVLMMDGSIAGGTIVSAAADSLRIRAASGEVVIHARDVMRVDRAERAGRAIRDGIGGAALGTGVVGVLGLVAGVVPPPRLFLAGAIAGAHHKVQMNASGGKSVIVYLAAAASPSP